MRCEPLSHDMPCREYFRVVLMVYLVSFDSDPTGSDVEKTQRDRILGNWSGSRAMNKWGVDFNVGRIGIFLLERR